MAGFFSDGSRLGCVGGTPRSTLLALEVARGVAPEKGLLPFSLSSLLLLCHSFLSFASSLLPLSFLCFFLPLLSQQQPTELFLVSCGGGSNENWLGFLVMEEFVDARHRWGGFGFFFLSSALLACSALSSFLFNATPSHLPDFTGQQRRCCGLWTSLLGKTQLSQGSNAGRVQQIFKAAAVVINKASNEQGNGSWLSSKGASSSRWGTSIRCWRGSPE